MSNFGLFYQRNGGYKGFNGRCIIASGCVLNGARDGVGGDLFVSLQMLLHFRLGHRRCRSGRRILRGESWHARRETGRRGPGAHPEWWRLGSWWRSRHARRNPGPAWGQECRIDVGLRGAGHGGRRETRHAGSQAWRDATREWARRKRSRWKSSRCGL